MRAQMNALSLEVDFQQTIIEHSIDEGLDSFGDGCFSFCRRCMIAWGFVAGVGIGETDSIRDLGYSRSYGSSGLGSKVGSGELSSPSGIVCREGSVVPQPDTVARLERRRISGNEVELAQ
jgi:hypothetical protein